MEGGDAPAAREPDVGRIRGRESASAAGEQQPDRKGMEADGPGGEGLVIGSVECRTSSHFHWV